MGRWPCVVCALLGLFSWSLKAHAQAASNSAGANSELDNAKDASVLGFYSTKIRFENDGTGTQQATARVQIQSDAGVKRFGLLTFGYQGASQTVDINYVRVRKPDGTTVTTPPDNVQDLDAGITRAAPFYSDLREKHVAVRGLSTGDALEYQVTWRTTKPLVPGQFWYGYDFEHTETVLDEELEINAPRERPLKIKSQSVQPAITEDSGRRVYTWRSSNQKDSSKSNAARVLEAALGRAPPPDVLISTFQSWDEVGRWYWNLQRDRILPSPAIQSKIAELTNGSKNTTATLHAAYDYVSTKFRYIGVAFGIGRYQPHSAEDVLSNQYGDCKDKHTLLASLLQAAGVIAYPALINSDRKVEPDVPSPAQFDHVISVVPEGKDYVWLDTTAEVGPFGFLVSQLRDKQALMIPGDKPAMFLTTPADPPFQNSVNFKLDGKLSDNGTLDAKMDHASRGDSEILIRSAFRQVAQSQWKDLVQQISIELGFAGTVSDVTASAPEATAEPFHFSYTYNRKDYPDWANHRITVPGIPFYLPQVSDDDAHAKDPIWLGSSMQTVSDSRVGLPKGYVAQLPAAVALVRDYAEYHASYTQNHGVLISQRRMVIKLRQVPPNELADYKEFLKGMNDDINRYIILDSAASTATGSQGLGLNPGAIWALPDSGNAEAVNLDSQARAAMQRVNLADAADLMKKALAADPKFVRGWITLGTIYMASHQVQPGLDAFQKAIDTNPKEPITYRTMGYALTSMGRQDEAIKVWQGLLKVVPDDPEATSSLGTLLYEQRRYSEALPLLESAANADPGSAGALSRLGVVYLKLGNAGKGLAEFQEALKIDSSPSSLNNVAHDLADASADLTDALGYAEKAVHDQEDASRSIQLTSLKMEDLQTTEAIGSFWDTLGWVQFRLGHLELAEKYLRASWQLSQQPMAGDHLGQLYAQQQKKDTAIHMYRLALAASETQAYAFAHTEIQQHLSALLPGVDLSTGVDLHRGPSAGEELSQMRNVKLSRLVNGTASAEFFLLFGPGAKVEAVRFISGSDKLRSVEKTIQLSKFPIAYPEGSAAHLVRRGIVACSEIGGCDLVFFNPEDVKSIN